MDFLEIAQSSIYELENKEYLNFALVKYLEKYNSFYLNLVSKVNSLKLKKVDTELLSRNKKFVIF